MQAISRNGIFIISNEEIMQNKKAKKNKLYLYVKPKTKRPSIKELADTIFYDCLSAIDIANIEENMIFQVMVRNLRYEFKITIKENLDYSDILESLASKIKL